MKRITDIKPLSKKSSHYRIYLKDELFGEVDETSVKKYGIRVGMEIKEELLKKLVSEDEIAKVKSYAFGLLARRSYSRKGMSDKLKKKGFSNIAVNSTIVALERLGYIKDEEFARNWVETRKRLKPKGKFALRNELYRKGIDEAIVDQVLAEIDKSEEYEMAQRAAEKKVKRYKKLEPEVGKRRMFSFLQRRGFGSDIAGEITEKLLSEN